MGVKLLLAGMIVQGVMVAASGVGLLVLMVFIIRQQSEVAKTLYASEEG